MFKSITIKNFKSLKNVRIEFNHQFNVIIGPNSVGKTTVFEAIRLWKLCYDNCIQKSNKKKFYYSAKNLLFTNSESLRIYEDKDLFNTELFNQNKNYDIEIGIELEIEERVYNLGFQITKAHHIDDAYLQINYIDGQEFKRFSDENLDQFNLTNIFVISDARAIANIVAKEPYMYKSQVRDKINKGKGYDVLRNKIISTDEVKNEVENHLKNIFGIHYEIKEKDKDNRTYINLLVNNTNILSQGSGFIQVAEIFSSLEYMNTERFILLIDEPDAHLHIELQRKLIEELKGIGNSQIFVISHNKEFIECAEKSEMIHFTREKVETGLIINNEETSINEIIKSLTGVDLEKADRIKNANNIVLCEGDSDIIFLNKLFDKYINLDIKKLNKDSIFIEQLQGIDTINEKLMSYSRALNNFVNPNTKWTIIRDQDCLPLSKNIRIANDHKRFIKIDNHNTSTDNIIFQNGYGIESTFFTEIDKLSSLLINYYEIHIEGDKNEFRNKIIEKKSDFLHDIERHTSDLFQEFDRHLARQKQNRNGYEDIIASDIIKDINGKIEYILTKQGIDKFLSEIHQELSTIIPSGKKKLDHGKLIEFYFNNLDSEEKIYDCHKELVNKIFS